MILDKTCMDRRERLRCTAVAWLMLSGLGRISGKPKDHTRWRNDGNVKVWILIAFSSGTCTW